MQRMKAAAAILVGLVLVGIVSWKIAYPNFHIRYRLELTVKDHDKIRTGSGVIEVVYPIWPESFGNLGGGATGISHEYGYAVTTDLRDEGLLFAVFRMPSLNFYKMGYPVLRAYGFNAPLLPTTLKEHLRQLERKSGWVEVPSEAIPLLVHFRNINDPWSAEKVDPRDLSSVFGPDVELLHVRLELTDEPLTGEPDIWPKWLKDFSQGNLGGANVTSKAPLGLEVSAFKGF